MNIGSGNLNIQIPLVHLPGRNGHDFDLSLTYNSQNWTPVASLTTPGPTPPADYDQVNIGWSYPQADLYAIGSTGWKFNLPVLYATGVMTPPPTCANGPQCGGNSYSQSFCVTNFYVVAGDGSKYQFSSAKFGCTQTTTTCLAGGGGCNYNTYNQPDILIDYDNAEPSPGTISPSPYSGQGVMLDLTNAASGNGTAVVRLRDGSQIQFPINNWGASSGGSLATYASLIADSNGNVISVSQSGQTITDTLNRSITITGNSIQYKDSNGQPRTVTLNYSSQFPNSAVPTFTSPAVGQSGIAEVAATPISTMLSSIVLPDGLSYSFQYNEFGEVVEVTYPSGGYTRYAYAPFPINDYEWTTSVFGFADNREVIDKYTCPAVAVAAGITTPSGYVGSSAPNTCPVSENHTHYGRPTGTLASYPVSVSDPDGNTTVYGSNVGYTYPGASVTACGTPYLPPTQGPALMNYPIGSTYLETTRAVYQGTSTLLRSINPTYQGCYKIGEAITLPDGLTSGTTWTYDTAPNSYTVTVIDRGPSESFAAYAETDNVLYKNEYAFGQGAPGPLLRQTKYLYLATNSVK